MVIINFCGLCIQYIVVPKAGGFYQKYETAEIPTIARFSLVSL